MSLKRLKAEIGELGDRKKAKDLQWFFKTGPGEYAEGDRFLGITVPRLRDLARRYPDLTLQEILQLLRSPIHEKRFLSLLLLMRKYGQADLSGKKRIYQAYLRHTACINNWDLVDVSAKNIPGAFLEDKDRAPLYKLAWSNSLWERRIAVLSTFRFIANNDFKDALKIGALLVADSHDLIHKAVGWMLREIGKRDRASEESFLKKYCAVMPRTMLRYAVERFPESKRQAYLRKPRSNSTAGG